MYILVYRVGNFSYWIRDNGKELLSTGTLNSATKFNNKKEAYETSAKLLDKWFYDRLKIEQI